MIIAGTGHRPNKLGGYSNEAAAKLFKLARYWLSNNKPEKVISGMALGWDMALAHAAVHLGIPLVAAIPFKGQESRWSYETVNFYHDLLKQAERIEIVSDGEYAPWKMQARNEWMVDHCDTVLALWDGSNGGTGNCVAYANKAGKPIINLWNEYDA